jgi:hypothetical protein
MKDERCRRSSTNPAQPPHLMRLLAGESLVGVHLFPVSLPFSGCRRQWPAGGTVRGSSFSSPWPVRLWGRNEQGRE